MAESQTPGVPWPNQQEPIDGVVPTAEISQDADLFEDDDLDAVMEG